MIDFEFICNKLLCPRNWVEQILLRATHSTQVECFGIQKIEVYVHHLCQPVGVPRTPTPVEMINQTVHCRKTTSVKSPDPVSNKYVIPRLAAYRFYPAGL